MQSNVVVQKGYVGPWSHPCNNHFHFIVYFFMSDPSRFFQNFDMDDMLVTRSEDQTPPQRGGRNLLGRGRVRPQGPPPPITPVQGFTGLRYDTQYLSPTSAQRAIEGLRSSDFVVDRVQSHGFGQDRYFAFQLSAPTAVRLYTPAGGRSRIQCTCEDYRSIPSACVHIYVSFLLRPVRLILLIAIVAV